MAISETEARLAAITVEQLDDDPYPIYAWLREHAPVAWVPGVGLWLATTWEAVEQAAGDADTFSAGVTPSPLDRTMGEGNILLIDGPGRRPCGARSTRRCGPVRSSSGRCR